MISKLLSSAVKLYLRSQVTQVEDLQVKISGQNKQILQGYIPQVFLSCDRAIYQGLNLSQIELNGLDIAINLPEVIKKKPLRFLEPIFVEIKLKLDAADLQASLDSKLLRSGLDDLWQMILATQINNTSLLKSDNLAIDWHSIVITDQVLNLAGKYQDSAQETKEICLSTELSLADDHTLCLSSLRITNQASFDDELDELKIDLGTDVAIAELIIESEQILCSGKIRCS